MFQRLRRTAASFVMVLVCFLGYRLLAVPLIEPRVAPALSEEHSPEDPNLQERSTKGRQMDPYRRFFPPGAWEVDDPIVLENDRALLLMREYRTLDNGRVELMPCTVLFLPDGPLSGDPEDALRRVIILQAPQGALLQFDQPVDLTRAKIGHLIGGDFHGPITIHGNAGKPDAPEDLLIVTSDVQMNTQLIWTLAPVEFHFGPNSGTGREMQIHLIASDRGGRQGPSVGGLESLDLLHDVQMRLVPGSAGMMPLDGKPQATGQRPAAGGVSGTGGSPVRPGLPPPVPDMAPLQPLGRTPGQLASKPAPLPQPPVDIRCQGKFHFDLLQYIATFEDQVDVLRVMQDGPSDQMNCERLSVYFAPRVAPTPGAAATNAAAQAAAPAAPPSAKEAAPGRRIPNNLEPRRIDARGHPVIVRAPSSGVYARGEHLDYNILSGRLLLEGGDEVTLQQIHNEIHARSVDYQPGEAGRLGILMAVGPGWLRGAPPQNGNQPVGAGGFVPVNPVSFNPIAAPAGPQPPLQLFEAHWSDKLQMGLDEKSHKISLVGNARAGYTGQGELSADQIYLWLNDVLAPEPPRGSPRLNPTSAAPAPAGPPRTQVQPDRMLAQGNVRINSPQLSGNTARLESWFAQAPPEPAIHAGVVPGAAGSPGAPTGTGLARPQQRPGAPGSPQSPPSHYQIDGERIQVRFLMHGPTTELSDLFVDGQVRLTETMLATAGSRPEDSPLEIRGDRLQVQRANQSNTGVTVSGKPAQAGSRGMEMYGEKIELDKGLNQLWINGPGRMKLPASRVMADGGGGPGSFGPRTSLMPAADFPSVSASPAQPPAAPLIVTWQEGMTFDGLKAQFKRGVVAQTDAPTEIRTMRTELLDVSLRRRIDFGQPKMSDHADVGQIVCHDDVKMESRTQDTRGPTSFQQMESHDLTIDEATGLIDGKGPGWLTSVRLGSPNLAGSLTPGTPGAAPPGPTPTAANKNQLTYIRVDFQGPITGNINQHLITFHDQVNTIYGPVPAWNARLDDRSIDALGPNGGKMTCDALTVLQTDLISPATAGRSAHHPLEMMAERNVVAIGQLYTARCARLTYTEAKDLIVLEGDGRGAAQLSRQERPGAPTSTTVARRIQYLRSANRVEVNDVRSITADQPGDPNSPPSANGAKPNGKRSLLNDDPKTPKQK